jgi:hypothetical protein
MNILINKVNFAIVGLMSSMSVAMADDANSGICELVTKLGGLLVTLRTMAFIGAGFLIAQWAWEFIMKPDDVKLEKLKPKGVGLVVGFILLFAIGAVISFLMSVAGEADCADQFRSWSVETK